MYKPVKTYRRSSGDPWIWATLIILSAFGLLVGAALFMSVTSFRFSGMTFTGEQSNRQQSGEIEGSVETIEIQNMHGSIAISHQAELGWNWDITTWADTQEKADELSDLILMDVSESDGKKKWELILPEDLSECNGIKSDLTLHVPKSVEVIVSNQHGETAISDVEGSVEVNSEHGDISCSTCLSQITIDSRHGEVELSNFGGGSIVSRHGDITVLNSSKDISINSGHGSILARDVVGSFEIDSAHGDIDSSNIRGDVSIKNRHGDVNVACRSESVDCSNTHSDTTIRIEDASVQNIDIRGQHGDIDLSLPESLRANITTKVRHGDIQNDLESFSDSPVVISVSTTHDDIRIRKHKLPESTPVSAEVEVEKQSE